MQTLPGTMLLLGTLLLSACSSETTAESDAATDLRADDGASPDQGRDVTTQPDGGVDSNEPVELDCDPSLSLDPLQLHADYCVVVRAPMTGTPNAFNLRDEHLWTFREWGVDRWTIGGPTDLQGPEVQFSFTPIIPDGSTTAFPGEYLTLSPSGTAAVGYTVDTTFAGAVVWGTKGQTTKTVADANGNYSALLLDDQTLLVNGLGVGAAQQGQAVYVVAEGKAPRVLIKDFGTLSGVLALGETLVFAGGLFGSESQVYAFSRDEIEQASASGGSLTPDDGVLIYEGNLLGATAMGDDLVAMVADSMYVMESVRRFVTARSGDVVSVSTTVDLVTPFGALAVARLAGDGERLGLLLRDGMQTEVALIQPR